MQTIYHLKKWGYIYITYWSGPNFASNWVRSVFFYFLFLMKYKQTKSDLNISHLDHLHIWLCGHCKNSQIEIHVFFFLCEPWIHMSWILPVLKKKETFRTTWLYRWDRHTLHICPIKSWLILLRECSIRRLCRLSRSLSIKWMEAFLIYASWTWQWCLKWCSLFFNSVSALHLSLFTPHIYTCRARVTQNFHQTL